MCTYTTEQTPVTGSGKGAPGWFALRQATVYYDHPVHAQAAHTLNIDLADPSRGPAARVALELTAESALDLVDAIHAALAAVPPDLLELDPARRAGAGDRGGQWSRSRCQGRATVTPGAAVSSAASAAPASDSGTVPVTSADGSRAPLSISASIAG